MGKKKKVKKVEVLKEEEAPKVKGTKVLKEELIKMMTQHSGYRNNSTPTTTPTIHSPEHMMEMTMNSSAINKTAADIMKILNTKAVNTQLTSITPNENDELQIIDGDVFTNSNRHTPDIKKTTRREILRHIQLGIDKVRLIEVLQKLGESKS